MKRQIIIVCCLFLGISLSWGAEKKVTISCGDWIELKATPMDNCYFVRWSDDDTTAVRRIQVNEDSHYIAFFASRCGEEYNLPILTLYDWLLMLDVRTSHDIGYHFGEENVTWYRIVGELDTIDDTFPQDDETVCKGYYLTIDRNLWTTGDYYAVVDVSATPSGELCHAMLRTHIAHFAGAKPKQKLALSPTFVAPGAQMKLMGLDPWVQSVISVYDMVGKLLYNTTSQNESTFYLNASTCPGCYNVVVNWGDEQQTLRYLVNNK